MNLRASEPVIEIIVPDHPTPQTRTAPTRPGMSFTFTCRFCGSAGFSAEPVVSCPACRKPLTS